MYRRKILNTRFIVTGVSFGRGIKPEEATGRNVEDRRTKAFGKGFLQCFDRGDETPNRKGRAIEDCKGEEGKLFPFS